MTKALKKTLLRLLPPATALLLLVTLVALFRCCGNAALIGNSPEILTDDRGGITWVDLDEEDEPPFTQRLRTADLDIETTVTSRNDTNAIVMTAETDIIRPHLVTEINDLTLSSNVVCWAPNAGLKQWQYPTPVIKSANVDLTAGIARYSFHIPVERLFDDCDIPNSGPNSGHLNVYCAVMNLTMKAQHESVIYKSDDANPTSTYDETVNCTDKTFCTPGLISFRKTDISVAVVKFDYTPNGEGCADDDDDDDDDDDGASRMF